MVTKFKDNLAKSNLAKNTVTLYISFNHYKFE